MDGLSGYDDVLYPGSAMNMPPGMSPNWVPVDFFPCRVGTRPGLVSQFPVIGGAAAN